MSKKITRSTVNEEQYSAPEFPKSGFAPSYRRYTSFLLGRIHVGGFHWTMPGDKISGRTSGLCTFKRITTPLVTPVNAMQYNVYLPLRPLDRTFKKGITPTKLNAMSANWSMPTVTTRYLVDQIMRAYFGLTPTATTTSTLYNQFFNVIYDTGDATESTTLAEALSDVLGGSPTVKNWLYNSTNGIVTTILYSLTNPSGKLRQMAAPLYLEDALLDIAANITAKLGSIDNPLSESTNLYEFTYNFLDCLLTPFVGRYSYYAELKYNFLRPWDLYRISHHINWTGGSDEDFIDGLDDTPLNEYPLRAMYAIWYELFRNVDLEPVSPTLPDWQEWGSTSIFDMANGGNLLYLIYRIRSWEKDMFISAQIDDLSRHVYAPILSTPGDGVGYHVNEENNFDTQSDDNFEPSQGTATAASRKPAVYTLGYRDQLSDSDKYVSCPVPSNVNDVLASLDRTFTDVYGLDLNTLRQSQMLERYLKRNYLFGDEYQDRMLAHYNSRVSDMRINKPEVLSQSMDGYDMGQEVSNVSTDETKVGDRTATATIPVNGEEFTTFCEEFGLIFSIVCFMPRAMYDGVCPQLLSTKQIDLPLPEFASNNEEFGRKMEIAGSGLVHGSTVGDDNRYMFGRYPAYHAWRGRVDEVGGDFLDELQDSTFRRFFGMFSDDTTPKLNYFFIHCRPNLNMFANNVLYDAQIYGDLVHDCSVERVLPTPVEVI